MLALCAALLASALPAVAEVIDTGHVQAELVSEVDAVVPGDTFWVLLKTEITPGWHTYWRNPGDSGAPITLDWDLPDGMSAGPITWPVPERIPYGPLMNYGYHGTVLYPIELTVPEDLAGDQVTLQAKGEWLVCEEICIPERGTLSLTLPVRETASGSNQALFESARSRIPAELDLPIESVVDPTGIRLSIKLAGLADNRVQSAIYFPYTADLIDNPAPQRDEVVGDALVFTLQPGYDFKPGANLAGLVVVTEASGTASTDTITTAFSVGELEVAPITAPATGSTGLLTAILFALLGGLILNLMPCVFPVLSIKILSLMQHADGHASKMRAHGWFYVAGVVASFLAIALLLILLRAGGAEIGWGFQLQSPTVVGFLAYLFVLIGLNLFGFFELGTSMMNLGQAATLRRGYGGSFATGVLATVVAAPCTVPFMASAVGYALTRDNITALTIFAALGIGMALPYLLLCYSPRLLKKLPKPGPWMARFRELLAFPMFASAIWLIWVLSQQAGSEAVTFLLVGMLLLGFAIWLLLHRPAAPVARACVMIVALVLASAGLYLPMAFNTDVAIQGAGVSSKPGDSYEGPVWDHYSASTLKARVAEGPVFVNFTAAWCLTCKVNERVALDSTVIRDAFERAGIAYLKGDWTNEDPEITRALAEYERSGVPLYLLYRKGADRATVLPQVLTESGVLRAIENL